MRTEMPHRLPTLEIAPTSRPKASSHRALIAGRQVNCAPRAGHTLSHPNLLPIAKTALERASASHRASWRFQTPLSPVRSKSRSNPCPNTAFFPNRRCEIGTLSRILSLRIGIPSLIHADTKNGPSKRWPLCASRVEGPTNSENCRRAVGASGANSRSCGRIPVRSNTSNGTFLFGLARQWKHSWIRKSRRLTRHAPIWRISFVSGDRPVVSRSKITRSVDQGSTLRTEKVTAGGVDMSTVPAISFFPLQS